MAGKKTTCLYDTGAQICLADDQWLDTHFPDLPIRPISELLSEKDAENLQLKTATNASIPHKGWVEIPLILDPETEDSLSMPFL